MAEKRISELTAKGSNLQSTDIFEVAVSNGVGGYNTRYITGAEITGAVSGVNIYNANGTLTGNRTVTHSSYTLSFNGTTRVISPSALVADTAFVVRDNTDSANLMRISGKGTIGLGGYDAVAGSVINLLADASLGFGAGVDVVSTLGATAIRGNAYGSGQGVWGLSNTGTGVYGQSNNIGVYGISTGIAVYGLSSGGFAGRFDGTTKTVSPSASVLDTAFVVRNNTDTADMIKVKGNGVINCLTMPTSSAGLVSGDLWSDSGTIKIV